MSWKDMMRRVLPPIGGVLPDTTSAFGATDRPPGSSNPHGGVDFNYRGARKLNQSIPAIRSPVTGIVTLQATASIRAPIGIGRARSIPIQLHRRF